MIGTRSRTATFALLASVCIFIASSPAQTAKQPPAKAAPTAQPNVPAEYQAGIAQMRLAKGYLEKAGDKWGGYRVRAIGTLDQAFRALGVSPESTPQEMVSGNVDEPGMMNSGIACLQAAKADFAKAGNNWGGRREKGVALINQALGQLQTGINWAKANKTY